MAGNNRSGGVDTGNLPAADQSLSNDSSNQPDWEKYASARKTSDMVIKIEIDGDAVTTSNIEEYEEYLPLFSQNSLMHLTRQTNPNAASSRIESGRVSLQNVPLVMPKHVAMADCALALCQGTMMDIEIVRFGHMGGEERKELMKINYREVTAQNLYDGADSWTMVINANGIEYSFTGYDQTAGEEGNGTFIGNFDTNTFE